MKRNGLAEHHKVPWALVSKAIKHNNLSNVSIEIHISIFFVKVFLKEMLYTSKRFVKPRPMSLTVYINSVSMSHVHYFLENETEKAKKKCVTN